MTLSKDSLEWSLNFLKKHSDGDIFPKLPEIDAIIEKKNDFIQLIEGKPLTEFIPNPCRRFIVPKDEISYRQATQLHPQDSILLSALVYQFGQGIENRRLSAKRVFSYRFLPSHDEGLYSSKTAWNDFWTTAHKKTQESSFILICDIADFYNQIYHHTVENQLADSGFPNQAIKWIRMLLESTTAGVSRGVPIGPHAIHLIAEASLIPIDNSIQSRGLDFIRFIDDMVIFCNSEKDATKALSILALTLDRQQRLMLQKHKTKIYTPHEFRSFCQEMLEDRPIDDNEERLLEIIKKYTGDNPYISITYNDIKPEDWEQFSDEIVTIIIKEYLAKKETDYIRLRWFYRRLAQVGHPGALKVSIDNISKLGPCFASICAYIASIQSIEPEQWKILGGNLLQLLESEEVLNNEFFRISILSLFTKNEHINHFPCLAKVFQNSDPFSRREIILASIKNGAIDWLREQKETYLHMDPWQQMSFIYCASGFPKDEKKFFINRFDYGEPFKKILAKWSKST